MNYEAKIQVVDVTLLVDSSRLQLIASMNGMGTGLASILLNFNRFNNGFFFIKAPGYLNPVRSIPSYLFGPGGLLAGSLVYFLAREKGGYGVSEVMAVSGPGRYYEGGAGLGSRLCFCLTFGSGGSAGLQGPIVHIGSSIGSV
jgi:CIC family chloride channel protein